MCRVDILPSAYITAAVLLLVLPLRLLFAWFLAAAVHELGHIAAVLALKGSIKGIRIGAFGASIDIYLMTPFREMLAALAGPISGLLLLLFIRRIPTVAIFAFLQSAYNLLPLYPLDGGRVLRCALIILAGDYRAERILNILETLLLILFFAAGILSFILWNMGILPLTAALLLAVKHRIRKIPCKSMYLGLQ